MFYLLERLRLALEDPAETARVKLMVVDEAWRYLRDPAVLSYLAEAAKTWRKKNAALILATQSAVDLTGTAGAEALLESHARQSYSLPIRTCRPQSPKCST